MLTNTLFIALMISLINLTKCSICNNPGLSGNCIACTTTGPNGFSSFCSDANPLYPICNSKTSTCNQCITDVKCIGPNGFPKCNTNNKSKNLISNLIYEGSASFGIAVCNECLTNIDCFTSSSGPICDQLDNFCPACTNNDCFDNLLHCASSGQCVACTSSSDCLGTTPIYN